MLLIKVQKLYDTLIGHTIRLHWAGLGGGVLAVADMTPVIRSVAPLYGPEAGGTNITLEGRQPATCWANRCSLSGQCNESGQYHREYSPISSKKFM